MFYLFWPLSKQENHQLTVDPAEHLNDHSKFITKTCTCNIQAFAKL